MSIYGLILAGGRSTRMKSDKRKISYHKENQLNHTYNLLKSQLSKVYISLNVPENLGLPTIVDKTNSGGPMNGLMSAFALNKSVAWLVIAIDMPLIQKKHINLLITKRNKLKTATGFLDNRGLLYPLFTIYESSAYPILQSCEHNSLSKFLNDHKIEEIITQDKSFLTNANTQKEAEDIRALIRHKLE